MISTYIGDQDRILGPFEDIDEIDYLFYPSIEAKRISLSVILSLITHKTMFLPN